MTAWWLDYEFTVYEDVFADWPEVGGLYVFASREKTSLVGPRWLPLYVGRTRNFCTRLPTHERWQEAQRLGATHLHLRVEPEEAKRQAWRGG